MRQPTPGEDRPDAFAHLQNALDRAEEVHHDPDPGRRRAVVTTALFAVALVVLAAAIAYGSAVFAVDRAATHTDQRVAVLESDLRQRRSAAAEQNAARDQQIAELRRLVCLFADHSQPRDRAVEDVRRDYGCIPTPTPRPTAS